MKDEEDDIIPNEDDSNEALNESTNEETEGEGFDDVIRPSTGSHFYENDENPEDTITKVTGMYKDWFLDYASYVILERAVPAITQSTMKSSTSIELTAPSPLRFANGEPRR